MNLEFFLKCNHYWPIYIENMFILGYFSSETIHEWDLTPLVGHYMKVYRLNQGHVPQKTLLCLCLLTNYNFMCYYIILFRHSITRTISNKH